MRRYSWWVRAVSGSIHSFWRNKEVLACVRPWTMWVPTVSLSMYVPLPMLSLVDNVDHAVPRTPARWTTTRPEKGMTRRRRSHNSGGNVFFHEIQRPFRRVPDVRWRNHYFARNKETFPCVRPGLSCRPLHVQSTFDGCHSLTTLTTPRREHQGGGRR